MPRVAKKDAKKDVNHTERLRQTVEKQAQLKFGMLPQEYAQRIQQADNSELERWTERILFANSIEALFA